MAKNFKKVAALILSGVFMASLDVAGSNTQYNIKRGSLGFSDSGVNYVLEIGPGLEKDNSWISILFRKKKFTVALDLPFSYWMVNSQYIQDFLQRAVQEIKQLMAQDGNGFQLIERLEKSFTLLAQTMEETYISDLKQYLRIPVSKEVSLLELQKRKVNLDISKAQLWVGEIAGIKETSERIAKLNQIKDALVNYMDIYKEEAALQNSAFLWTLMAMLRSYPSIISENIDTKTVLKHLGSTTSDSLEPFQVIYDWLHENDPEFLGEYTM